MTINYFHEYRFLSDFIMRQDCDCFAVLSTLLLRNYINGSLLVHLQVMLDKVYFVLRNFELDGQYKMLLWPNGQGSWRYYWYVRAWLDLVLETLA